MEEYDIGKAFAGIENELLDSMMRNMKNHRAEETERGYEWSQWQVEQLKALEEYRREHEKEFEKEYGNINQKMRAAILRANVEGGMTQETQILRAIMKGAKFKRVSDKLAGEFFRINERKMDALIRAVTQDMERTESAILRMHDDKVRKAIFNAQVYANSGAGTYEKAVDMAVKDYAYAGINCVRYKNGRQVNIKDYAEMALRTASKRAYLTGEGEKRQEWGVHTVIMNKRGNACPKCLPWVGRVLIDDVWSGGTVEEAKEGGYPLMSTAMAAGLYHPNCRDSHTTFFPEISSEPDKKWTKSELEEIERKSKREARQQYAKNQAEKFRRMERCALDQSDQRAWGEKADQWEEQGAGSGNVGDFVGFDQNADYRIDLPEYSWEINQELSKTARKVARHGSDHRYEYSALIDLDTGKEVDFGTSEEYSSVNHYYQYLKGHLGGRFAMVHNHNTESGLSLPDMQELASWKELESIVSVSNNGQKINAVVSNGKKTGEYLLLVYEKIKKECMQHRFTQYEIEQRLVQQAVQDYAKGGIREYGKR